MGEGGSQMAGSRGVMRMGGIALTAFSPLLVATSVSATEESFLPTCAISLDGAKSQVLGAFGMEKENIFYFHHGKIWWLNFFGWIHKRVARWGQLCFLLHSQAGLLATHQVPQALQLGPSSGTQVS